MSISLVGTATGTTTCTVPAHVAGDLIVIFAFRSATGSPTAGSGYTSIANGNGTSCSGRVGYKIATSTSDASGTWTNAAALVCHVYRASGGVMGIGASSAIHGQTTNTINYPALTLQQTDGTSWVAGFAGVNNLTNTISVAPSGMTNESIETAAANQAAGHDTEGGVSSWSSTNATTTGTAGDSVSVAVELLFQTAGSVPSQMVQHVGGGGNPYTRGNSGNAFTLPFPNATGSGNCLVLGFTCDAGATVSSVADNINGTWSAATASASGGAGNLDSYVYVFPNSGSGQVTITITFGSAVRVFGSCMTEFYGVATSSPVSAHSSAAYSTTVATGSFTPGSNNSIVWAYFCKAEGSGIPAQLVTKIVPGANFTLLDADIGWNNANDSLTHASEIYLQPTAVGINPALSVTTQSTDHWNSLGIALTTSGGAGTAPGTGIRIVKVLHFATEHYPTSGAFNLQMPAIGNLRVVMSTDPNLHAQTVTDNEGNTWSTDAAAQNCWYLPNASPNGNCLIILSGGGTDATLSWRCVDIVGAHSSPYDTSISNAESVNSVSSFTASPSPSPTASNGVMIANIELGQGPGLAVTAPSGAIWDLAKYTGEADLDLLENADIMAHYYYTASGTQTWTFTITSQSSNSTDGGFIAFKAAPAGTTVGLTGTGSLFAAGTFAPVNQFTLGNAGSLYAAGTLTAMEGATIALSGAGSLYAGGQFAPKGSVSLSGLGSLYSAGGFTEGASQALTGAGSLYASGALAPIGSEALTGSGTLYAAGTLTAVGGSTIALSGSGSLYSAGAFAPIVVVGLVGAGTLYAAASTATQTTYLPYVNMGMPFAAGSFTPSTGGAVTLTGSGSLFAAGSLTPKVGYAISGVGSLYSAGTFAEHVTIASVNAGTLFAAGTLVASGGGSFPLSGSGSLFSAGAFALAISSAETLAGAGSLFAPGSFSLGGSRAVLGAGTLYAPGQFIDGASTALHGAGSLYAAGTFSDSVVHAVSGAGSLYAAGTLVPTTGGLVFLPGIGTTFAAGAFSPSQSGSTALFGAGSHVNVGAFAETDIFLLGGAGVHFAAGTLVAVPVSGIVFLVGAGTDFAAEGFVQQSQTAGLVGVGIMAAAAQFAGVHPFVPRSQVFRIVGRDLQRIRLLVGTGKRRVVVGAVE